MEREKAKRLRDRILGWWASPAEARPELEAVYQNIFQRDLATLGLADDFYPVASAANYSLLYLILRLAADLRPKSVLDVGAGQSSVLWHRLAKAGLVGRVVTLEHDPTWAEAVRGRVEHDVIQSELAPRRVLGVETLTYDWSRIEAFGPFDAATVDGPVGTHRWSRFGIAAALPWIAEDAVLVFDDAERRGEWDTIKRVRDELRIARPNLGTCVVAGTKAQLVIASGAYWRATTF